MIKAIKKFLAWLMPKKQEPLQVMTIRMPFSTVKHPESYFFSLVSALKETGDLDYLMDKDALVTMEFGDHNAIHLLYFGLCDINVLMEPDKFGWQASLVCVQRTVGDEAYEGLKYLFSIPNMLAGEPPIIEDGKVLCDWLDRAKVYLA